MPDGFFASSKKRKRSGSSASGVGAQRSTIGDRKVKKIKAGFTRKPATRVGRRDEELDSDGTDEGAGIDDIDLRASDGDPGESADEAENETPAEKRLRLAKLYLESVRDEIAEGDIDAAEIDRELIASRLQQDVLDHAGKVYQFIAESLEPCPRSLRKRGHRLSVTCATISEDCRAMFTSSKDGSIIQWDMTTGKKVRCHQKVPAPKGKGKGKGKGKALEVEVKGHTDEVWALAVTHDAKYLASGGKDRRIGIWDVEKGEWITAFKEHRDSVTALTFRKQAHQLYSGSEDRTVRLFSVSPSSMGYIETLFGHQDHVTDLDSLRGETAVSSGARDKTVRYWKIPEETQLVFRGGGKSSLEGMEVQDDERGEIPAQQAHVPSSSFVEGRIDCVAMVDESTFVSGGDSGTICLWSTSKKKPIHRHPLAHGFHEHMSETEGLLRTPRWITSIAALSYSDLFASGSWDGSIRLWKLDAKLKTFQALESVVPAAGFVNSLQIMAVPRSHDPAWMRQHIGTEQRMSALLVAGLGQEARTGRWMRIKEAQNSAIVVPLIAKHIL